ncbi:TetR/AcrR family transcriptional regulator [Ferruginivarius sediminum]|uniref:TetR/AcrR family transcriptional regulator n=1 Tax=Ferruginivarius sediminum TaxID=2661937 RepID=A0A369T773_9PROT|nr:TetR/AcrR family transcriptional regulator [Ferruginivarius sediminum]RDD61181.1 TetR/AcrR family transcriptional regulator [Ferruginivarius sediminum]
MPRNGSTTRTTIMDAAEALILETGFSATSVDRVIDRAGVTKGTFFYHFQSKAGLARALVERYAEHDLNNLESNLARAEKLSRDPLQQLLIFVGLFEEAAEALTEPYPGCLFASYCSEAGLFDQDTLQIIRDTMTTWRTRLGAKIEEAMAKHPPRLDVDADSLADMITVAFEGAFMLSKSLSDPNVVSQQLGHYRNYLELLFAEAPSAPA